MWSRLYKAELAEKNRRDMESYLRLRREAAVQAGQAQAPLTLPTPKGPSEEERSNHKLVHQPPAAWCEFCVYGHGTELPRRRREELAAEHGPPPMELDYSFLKADGPVVESGAGEALHTTLSFWDESTQDGPRVLPTEQD